MDSKRAHADDIGDLQRARQRIEEQSRADAAASPFAMHGETRKNEKRYRMPRHSFDDALRRVGAADLARNDRVEPNDRLFAHADISLRRIRLLRLQRMTNEEAIESGMTAGEFFDRMSSPQFFYA